LRFGILDVTRRIALSGIQWQRTPPARPGDTAAKSTLGFQNVSAQELDYRARPTPASPMVLPDQIVYSNNAIATIFVGDDPVTWLRSIHQPPDTILDLYASIAKNYTARGRDTAARQLLYERNILEDAAEYERTHNFDLVRWVDRVTVGYGYYPSRGLAILLVFVVLGWLIFASGARAVTSEAVPRSWLVFSLDTIIPILELDPKNSDVTFSGFRQYYLYFMRLLGAGLAFLVFAFLKQAFVGPE